MSRWMVTTLLVTSTHAVAGPGLQLGSNLVGVGWTLHQGYLGVMGSGSIPSSHT
jgi:hypothetical protein